MVWAHRCTDGKTGKLEGVPEKESTGRGVGTLRLLHNEILGRAVRRSARGDRYSCAVGDGVSQGLLSNNDLRRHARHQRQIVGYSLGIAGFPIELKLFVLLLASPLEAKLLCSDVKGSVQTKKDKDVV